MKSFSLTILSTLLAAASAAPAANTSPNLQARGGDHFATVFAGENCGGNTLGSYTNFGCGGVCLNAGGAPIKSVLLNQQTTGNPKPTADFYADGNCGGDVLQHAGIFSGQNAGCTSFGGADAYSYYLYFNC